MKLTAGTSIQSDHDTVWRKTQEPQQHARWDLRFTRIAYLSKASSNEPQRFRYAKQIGLGYTIEGWGETLGQKDRRDSTLRFGSDDPFCLIQEGAGCWIYRPDGHRVYLGTVYDYRVRYGCWGKAIDRVFFRPLMVYATRWSFDRLRLWIERAIPPELSLRLWVVKVTARCLLGAVWMYEGLVPKLLSVTSSEIQLVRSTGLFWPTPQVTLGMLGALEILAGIWLIRGRGERAAVGVATVVMAVCAGVVIAAEPAALADPFGGISKNLGLIACAFTVWLLSPLTPKASRANEKRSDTS